MASSGMLPLRIALAGSVSSSRRVLQGLLRHRAPVVGVLGLDTELAARTSGYCRLDDLARETGIPYDDFRDINDPAIVEIVRQWNLDILFVVGLSQMVKSELLSVPRRGCVGFHPTRLPGGRGRAPIAWLVLDGRPGAATFFLMDEGADSGPILTQEPFEISDQDYAADVIAKTELGIDAALDRWLPKLLKGEWNPQAQAHRLATYYGRRAPEDGLIDWSQSARRIHTLIRAASKPHPGAYTYLGDAKMIMWHAELENELPHHGVPGRILLADANKWLVQTGDGLLWLTEVEFVSPGEQHGISHMRVGARLGYAPADEIYRLRRVVAALENQLSELEQTSRKPA